MQMNDKKIIICDLDGTIANVQHRLHYIKNPDGTMKPYAERDWNSFNAACGDDEPYTDVIQILWDLYYGGAGRYADREDSLREVYFFSGRNEAVRPQTIRWLWKHVLFPTMCPSVEITKEEYIELSNNGMGHTVHEFVEGYVQQQPNLYMRSENDFRPDTQVKFEMMYELKIMPEDVLCILDDRQSVVDMWRENGFRVMQVDAWKEPPSRHSLVTPTGKGTSPMMEPIPMLDTPDFDLGDIQENDSCSDK